jgi:hypothetical protein
MTRSSLCLREDRTTASRYCSAHPPDRRKRRATPGMLALMLRLGWFVRSLSIRRSAAATRSRARSKSAMVYCRGFGRVRFLRGPFATLLARMAALSCFPVAIGPLRFFRRIPPIKHIRRGVASRVALTLGVHGTEPTTGPSSTLPGTGQEKIPRPDTWRAMPTRHFERVVLGQQAATPWRTDAAGRRLACAASEMTKVWARDLRN